MSAKLISLDIQYGRGSTIDLSAFFPLSETHPITHTRHAHLIDDMKIMRDDIDLSEKYRITIERFRTIGTLDLAREDLRRTTYWQKKLLDAPEYQKTIILIEPISLPYGVLDIRTSEPIQSDTKYADLYTRRLPYGLMLRRITQQIRSSMVLHRKTILATVITIGVIVIPLLWYIKFSLESGYMLLRGIPQASSLEMVRSDIHEARGYFERANFLFFPFSWIPHETIQLADRATRGGLALSRAFDEAIGVIPTSSGSSTRIDRSTDIGPTYRAAARDYFFGEPYGIDTPTDWLEEHHESITRSIDLLTSAGEIYQSID